VNHSVPNFSRRATSSGVVSTVGLKEHLLPGLSGGDVRGARDRVDPPHGVLGQVQALVVPDAEDEPVIVAVLSAKLKRANVLDRWVRTELAFEQVEQERRTFVALQVHGLAPVLTAE
jgi:hypothetical protein